jgi:hypothetical protein
VDDFLRHRKLPSALGDRVRNYYAYTVEREVGPPTLSQLAQNHLTTSSLAMLC